MFSTRNPYPGLPVGAAAVIGLLVAALLGGTARAGDYGNSVADYLDYRPHDTNPEVAEYVLTWGHEQGIPGLEGGTPEEREARRPAVHEFIARTFLDGMVLPHQAPDAGVNVLVGKPHAVMFGPEGNVEDNEGNVARLGFERFGNYMFPQVHRLRDGRLLVRVYVGAEDPRYNRPTELLNYLSDDGGKSWQHIACYGDDERPLTEIAYRLADGEEIRYRSRTVEIEDASIKPWVTASAVRYSSAGGTTSSGDYYRLGDLPREMQWLPMLTRKPGQEAWAEEKAYWDPDTLLLGASREAADGGAASRVRRFITLPCPGVGQQHRDGSLTLTMDAGSEIRPMSDLRADGTFAPDSLNYVWRSFDRGRSWTFGAVIPAFASGPWFLNWRAHLESDFADGSWVAFYRTRGLYAGSGPMFTRRSTDQGKTWSPPQATRPGSSGVMPGLMLANGIAVRAYGRPGVFLMFCGDGKGELWGNDVTLIKPWKTQRDALSCNNPNLVATGPDRFVFVYSRFDMPDPWGQPRLAVVAQEFIVSRN